MEVSGKMPLGLRAAVLTIPDFYPFLRNVSALCNAVLCRSKIYLFIVSAQQERLAFLGDSLCTGRIQGIETENVQGRVVNQTWVKMFR